EISEWAIVAASFGEEPPATEAPAEAPPPAEAAAPETPVAEAPAEEAPAPQATPEEAKVEEPQPEETKTEEAKAEEPSAEEAKPEAIKTEPRPLPPGYFRATSQMMSLVGCSEPEMANVLRGLGYRVHPPSEENGPLYAFSVKPRFVREREEQRERQRQQERD